MEPVGKHEVTSPPAAPLRAVSPRTSRAIGEGKISLPPGEAAFIDLIAQHLSVLAKANQPIDDVIKELPLSEAGKVALREKIGRLPSNKTWGCHRQSRSCQND